MSGAEDGQRGRATPDLGKVAEDLTSAFDSCARGIGVIADGLAKARVAAAEAQSVSLGALDFDVPANPSGLHLLCLPHAQMFPAAFTEKINDRVKELGLWDLVEPNALEAAAPLGEWMQAVEDRVGQACDAEWTGAPRDPAAAEALFMRSFIILSCLSRGELRAGGDRPPSTLLATMQLGRLIEWWSSCCDGRDRIAAGEKRRRAKTVGKDGAATRARRAKPDPRKGWWPAAIEEAEKERTLNPAYRPKKVAPIVQANLERRQIFRSERQIREVIKRLWE